AVASRPGAASRWRRSRAPRDHATSHNARRDPRRPTPPRPRDRRPAATHRIPTAPVPPRPAPYPLPMVRVLIADDDPVMRMLLAAVINNDPALELVAQAEDADEAIALATETTPDVALLDVEMPGGGGPRAAQEIRAQAPQ